MAPILLPYAQKIEKNILVKLLMVDFTAIYDQKFVYHVGMICVIIIIIACWINLL